MAITLGSSFGLCTKKGTYDDLNGEKKALYDAALQHFERVMLIDPQEVLYFFERGTARPRVLYQGQDIANLNVLMIRSTGGREASSAMLAHTLAFCGCDTVDPLERFSVGFASKLLTTIGRFERGVGSNSYIAFGGRNAAALLQHLNISPEQPILYKPAAGRRGEGVLAFTDLDTALDFVHQADPDTLESEMPFLFQTLERFVAEYRVMVMNGDVLGMVQKIRAEGTVAANAAQGGTFVAADTPEVANFVREHVSHQGLIGVDVAIDEEGAHHIIETNRAPMWGAFEAATGVRVAEEVVGRIKIQQVV